jgi:hypothetical protein
MPKNIEVINQGPDFSILENQEKFLEDQKNTPEKVIDLINNSEERAWDENLENYIKQNLIKYRVTDNSDSIAIRKTIEDNNKKFINETRHNVSDELLDKAFNVVVGKADTQTLQLLEESDDLDIEKVLNNDEFNMSDKAIIILDTILKRKSYYEAVELNRGKKIEFVGFENESDISDIKDFIYKSFSDDLLSKCLISKIRYVQDKILIHSPSLDNYEVPIDTYFELKKIIPHVEEHRNRASVYTSWNTNPNFNKTFIPLPIDFYSFEGESPNKPYLEDFSDEKKMRLYKLGTVAHEIGHHMYDYLMDKNERKEWKEALGDTEGITEYAQKYNKDTSRYLKYDENFAEAIRLKTTSPKYLKDNFPKIDMFIQKHFPEIKG